MRLYSEYQAHLLKQYWFCLNATNIYIYIYILYEGCSNNSKPHPEGRAIIEYFCCHNTQTILIKLWKIVHVNVLIFVQVYTNVKSVQQI